jgi:c-di-GMP-binding flagellar brake protein YcgR
MKKLPIVISTELLIESIDHKPARTKSKILGARHGDFIIIEDPVLQLSDRLFSKLTGRIHCSYIYDGEIYDFISTVKKHMDESFSLIDYPQTFRQTKLRAYPRIHVNIETRMVVGQEKDGLKVIMTDISVGGCKLTVPHLYGVAIDAPCGLSFTLPDNRNISNLRGKIRNVRMMKLRKKTEIGISFVEPRAELEKIATFCHFCSFFATSQQ